MRAVRLTRIKFIVAALAAAAIASACGSSTTTVTAPSTISRCGVTLGASDATVPAEGGSGRITVTTARECAWSAAPEVSWLSISSQNSGQGDGAIEFRVGANIDPVVRRGSIVLNDKRAEITQAAGTCVIQLRQPSASFPQSGGTGIVEVVASSQLCTWTASADAEWITISSGGNGKGSASVSFAVAPTTGPPRTATISISNLRFSVTQSEGCSFAISPQDFAVGARGGDGSIAVSTAAGCPWASLSNVPWISVTEGAAGSGPGVVRFSVEPSSGPARVGSLVVAGQAFSVTQSAGCTYEVAPQTHVAPAAGGTFVVNVTAGAGCGWTAASSMPWITISGAATGSGNGGVSVAVAPTTGPARTGTVTVAGQSITVSQGQGCTFAITPESFAAPPAGGTGTVNVATETGCSWTASSQVNWITVTSGSSGAGNGAVGFAVAPSSGPPRSGTLLVAGRTFTVTQGDGCAIAVSPETTTSPAAGGTTSFTVQTAAGCGWSAASSVPWISIASGGTGTGNGTVQLSVAANAGAARTGTLSVSGTSAAGGSSKTFTVHQESGCSVTLSAPNAVVPAAGGSASVNVATEATCEWTVGPVEPWVSITSGNRGMGNGTVAFTVASNAGPARANVINIGGRPFTIEQQGGCTFSIAPSSQAVAAAGGETAVSVTGAAGCGWTAASNVPWMSVVSGASGSGNGVVQLSIAANVDAARTGTATIAGTTFRVDQASGCTFSVAPAAQAVPAAGGPGSFTVTASGAGCGWTAVPDVPWITISGNASGSGNGSVSFAVQPNAGAARSGTINVQGQVVTISQAAGG